MHILKYGDLITWALVFALAIYFFYTRYPNLTTGYEVLLLAGLPLVPWSILLVAHSISKSQKNV